MHTSKLSFARTRYLFQRPVVFSGACFALMLALRGWLQWIGPLPFDHFAVDRFGPRGLPTAVIHFFTGTEFRFVVGAVMVIGTVISWRLAGRDAAVGFVLSAGVVVWNAILKLAFGPVPFWAHGRGGVDYPSGHMSWATAVFGYIAWLGIERRQHWFPGLCLAIIVATGIERVLSGAHTISDLIGGALLAVAWIIIIISYVAGGQRVFRGAIGSGPGGS